jgi:hypothetical protein
MRTDPVLHDAGSPAGVCRQADAHHDRQWRAPLRGADSDFCPCSCLQRAWRSIGKMQGDEPTWICIHDLEAMPLVKGNILDVRRPEICCAVLAIALAKTVLQQSSPTTPCSGARLRRRSATSTNEARLAGNARYSQRRCRLRLASRQQCFLQSPPEASPRRRERPAEAKARRRGIGGALRCSRFK